MYLPFKVQVAATLADGTLTPWKTIGKYYAIDFKVNEDRNTVTVEADDILATVFNKTLPAFPVYMNMTFSNYLTRFCEAYKLPVTWLGDTPPRLKYAYCLADTKQTIQELIKSAAAVGHIAYDANDKEYLCIQNIAELATQSSQTLIDYSNVNTAYMQLFSIAYNKSVQTAAANGQVTWYTTSIAKAQNMYSYTATDLKDFVYDATMPQHIFKISRAKLSPAPMNNIDYISVCSQYTPNEDNFGVGMGPSRLTQYTFTGETKYRLPYISNEYEYTIDIVGGSVNSETQLLPEDDPEGDTVEIRDFMNVDFKYVHYKALASSHRAILLAWIKCPLQRIEVQWRYNPYVPLGSVIALDTHVYDITDFKGVLWSQTISYTSGGLQSNATLVNRQAIAAYIKMYDIAMSKPADSCDYMYAIGTLGKIYSVWRAPVAYADMQSSYEFVCEMPRAFTSAAIAFDGMWQRTMADACYYLRTEAKPWIFTVERGKLQAYHGCGAAPLLLQSGVKLVAAEKGFSPRENTDYTQDQGLVVAYVDTANKVHYRALAAADTAFNKNWYGPYDVDIPDLPDGSIIIDIQVHRLNDYRLGICVTTSSKVYWCITDRVYSQMAFRPEVFKVKAAKVESTLFGMRYDGIAATPQPNLTWVINAKNTVITATSDMALSIDDTLISRITGTANMPSVKSVSMTAHTITITLSEAATATFTLSIAANISLYAYVPDQLAQSGGYVVLEGVSHEFEIFIQQSAEETFSVGHAAVQSASVQSIVVTTNTFDVAAETFEVEHAVVSSVACSIADARGISAPQQSETFEVEHAKVQSVTCEISGVGVQPI